MPCRNCRFTLSKPWHCTCDKASQTRAQRRFHGGVEGVPSPLATCCSWRRTRGVLGFLLPCLPGQALPWAAWARWISSACLSSEKFPSTILSSLAMKRLQGHKQLHDYQRTESCVIGPWLDSRLLQPDLSSSIFFRPHSFYTLMYQKFL